MNFIIDIGNSASKMALIDETGAVVRQNRYDRISIPAIREFIGNEDIAASILCGVRDIDGEIIAFLEHAFRRFILFSHTTPMPIESEYRSPCSLGLDRIAAAIGAQSCYPGKNFLVVDFGTAITIDLIADNVYRGGNISPGAALRFKSLNDYTGRLPLCSLPETTEEIGSTTRSAIESGVVHSIVYEIGYYISHFGTKYEDLKIIFTGGDGKYFANKFKNTIFVNCELVIRGLNEVLKHNNALEEKL